MSTKVPRPASAAARRGDTADKTPPAQPDETLANDWRSRKKAATQASIRAHALRLFAERGYDQVTVEQIAAAAGVSHMTFFRYFPTKEDVVLSDSYDPMLVEFIHATPKDQPPISRIRAALTTGLARVYAADRAALLAQNKLIAATPALRARLWEDQAATQHLFIDALGIAGDDTTTQLRSAVIVNACLAAASTAVLTWAANNGTPELPELLDDAFDALTGDAAAARMRRPRAARSSRQAH